MIKAKKKYGQNFLKDEQIKEEIIKSIPDSPMRLVEIGAGLGDLTQRLVELNSKLDCFEIDTELCEILKNKFPNELKLGKISLLNCDILNSWDLIGKSKYFLVANLPYYAATNMILKAIDDVYCDGFIVMIQREVAIKFSSGVGDKEFSSLSILAQLKGDCELLFDVPGTAFSPPPKVTSSIIRLIKTKDLTLNLDYEGFKNFLKVAFRAPRKTLIKNFSFFLSKDNLISIFLEIGIPLKIRPHELSVTLYLEIFKKVNDERRYEFTG